MFEKLAFLCLLCLTTVNCDNVPTVANDFAFAYFNAWINESPPGVFLYAIVSNNNNATAHVTVTSPYPAFSTINVNVAPNSIFKIQITPQTIETDFPGDGPEGVIIVENKGIRLQSDQPVAVYAHAEIYEGTSADSFMVIPAIHLGNSYVAVTSGNDLNREAKLTNMITIVAYQDNTQINIGGKVATLNAFQTATLASKSSLSGTKITGSKPFAAISGNTCGQTYGDSCDYEAVMLLPVGGWGTQFVTIPFMYVTYNYYEVVANTDGTVVTSGGTQYPLNAGQFVQFPSPIGILTSNYPVQVVQLGQHTDDNNLGDPFFLQIPSTDKMSNTSVFFQPTGFIQHGNNPLVFFVRIVTNVNGAGRIALDGKVISALQFKRVASSTFYYYEVITTNNTHLVTATSPSVVYSVVSYTYGSYEACGFVCAFSLPVGNPGVPTNPPPTTTSLPTSPPTGKCPNGWAYFGTTNSCYQIFRQQVIWYVADEYCLSLNNGRHLTSIHSQAENDFIVNLARQVLTITDSPYTWIGLNDIANANQFKWSDRTPYDFQNWGAGEPIQQQGMENCGVLAVAKKCSSAPEIGKWKDVLCGTGNITSFVCKIPSA